MPESPRSQYVSNSNFDGAHHVALTNVRVCITSANHLLSAHSATFGCPKSRRYCRGAPVCFPAPAVSQAPCNNASHRAVAASQCACSQRRNGTRPLISCPIPPRATSHHASPISGSYSADPGARISARNHKKALITHPRLHFSCRFALKRSKLRLQLK